MLSGRFLLISLLTVSRYYIFVAFPPRYTRFLFPLTFPREVSEWSMCSSKKDQDWREYVSPVDFQRRNFFVICIYFSPNSMKFAYVWSVNPTLRLLGFQPFVGLGSYPNFKNKEKET